MKTTSPMDRLFRGKRSAALAGSLLVLLALTQTGCERRVAARANVNQDSVANIRKGLGGEQAAAPAAVALADPTGWGTIQGSFKLVGGADGLVRLPLPVNKDLDVCMPGGKKVLSEDLVVSTSGGIKDVVVYLTTKTPKDDPKWEHPDYLATKTAEVLFDQKNCVFLSHVFAMRSTNKVKMMNSDPMGHNANVVGKGKAASGNFSIAGNASSMYEPTGESPEPYDVSCSVHPWMSAKLLSRDNPYFAVSREDGSFEIKNVPAGVPLEFRVWQEASKFIQKVKVDGQDAKWAKGRFTVTLQSGETKKMSVEVERAVFGK